jgi:hypothetical protein
MKSLENNSLLSASSKLIFKKKVIRKLLCCIAGDYRIAIPRRANEVLTE